MKGIVIPVDGDPHEVYVAEGSAEATLGDMQRLVGGDVEPLVLPIFGADEATGRPRPVALWCDEGGISQGLRPNRAVYASAEMQREGYLSQVDFQTPVEEGDLYTILSGDVIALGFDPDTGESRSLTDSEATCVERYFREVSTRWSGIHELSMLAIVGHPSEEHWHSAGAERVDVGPGHPAYPTYKLGEGGPTIHLFGNTTPLRLGVVDVVGEERGFSVALSLARMASRQGLAVLTDLSDLGVATAEAALDAWGWVVVAVPYGADVEVPGEAGELLDRLRTGKDGGCVVSVEQWGEAVTTRGSMLRLRALMAALSDAVVVCDARHGSAAYDVALLAAAANETARAVKPHCPVRPVLVCAHPVATTRGTEFRPSLTPMDELGGMGARLVPPDERLEEALRLVQDRHGYELPRVGLTGRKLDESVRHKGADGNMHQ